MFNKKNIPLILLLLGAVVFSYLSGIGCPFHFFTGIPCCGCGMTRACISLLRLDFPSAFLYHPLCFLLPLVVIFVILQDKIPKRVFQRCLIALVAIFILVYIIRLCNPMDTIVKINIRNGFIYRFFCK